MRRYVALSVLLIPVMAVSAFMVIGRTEAQSANNRVQNVLISNETIIGEISPIEPAPEFLIAANPGEILSIDIVGIQPDMEPMFRIMDGSDEIIIEEWHQEGSDVLHADLFVLRSDRFAVQVQSANGSTGRFSLSVARNEEAYAEESHLGIGDTVTGKVNSEEPMTFYTLDYSSEEPLMLIVSSPTYLPPMMVENSETRQLIGQVMPPMPASMMCLPPGMNSHRVNIMYSGDVPEQAYELALLPVSGDFARYCTAQLAANSANAPVILSAFSPLTDVLPSVIPAGADDIGLDCNVVPCGADDIGITDGGGCPSGDITLCVEVTGGDTAGDVGCGLGDISLCAGVTGGGTAGGTGGGIPGCPHADITLCADVDFNDNGVTADAEANVFDAVDADANANADNGVQANADANVGNTPVNADANAGGDNGGVQVDVNAGGENIGVDTNDLGGLLGGGE